LGVEMTIIEAEAVRSRQQLADFIDKLRDEARANPERVENIRIEDYLEAMSAYLRDFPGLITNKVWSASAEDPTWALFAAVLAGAVIYE
jgi:hypothetical protein